MNSEIGKKIYNLEQEYGEEFEILFTWQKRKQLIRSVQEVSKKQKNIKILQEIKDTGKHTNTIFEYKKIIYVVKMNYIIRV